MMTADCHIHMVLDGVDFRAAIAAHRSRPREEIIRRRLARYQALGFTYLRDGGDRWGVGLLAKALAGEYGILYVIAKPHGKSGPSVDLISTERYAAKLNALYQAMGYPLPEKEAEEAAKKAGPRAPQERSSPERGNGSKAQTRTPDDPQPDGKPSVRGRLAALQAASKSMEKSTPVRQKERIR